MTEDERGSTLRQMRDDRSDTGAEEGPLQIILFRIVDRRFAFALSDVVEILPMVAITRVPESPRWLQGVIDLRGRTLPVINLRQRLDYPATEADLHAAIIVVKPPAREPVGFIVDRVLDIVTLPPGAVDPADAFGGGDHPVQAIAREGDTVILILDVNRLAADPRDLVLPEEHT